MKQYPEYKDSGIEWIGQVPKHWELKRLCWLGRFSASGIDKKSIEGELPVKMVNYTNVYGNIKAEINSNDHLMETTATPGKIKEHSLKKGDILFTPSSETEDEIGLSAVVMKELPNTVYSYHLIRFSPTVKLDIQFEKYFCNHFGVWSQFSKICKGTTRQILGRDDFREIIVTIPPVFEQKIISEHLDRKTEQIDNLITKKERMIELIKEERATIINQAVTKGLDPKVEMKDSGIEWLGKVPKHWEMKRLKYIVQGKLEYGANEIAEIEDTNMPRYIRITDFDEDGNLRKDTFKSLPEDKAKEYLLREGDVLFARSGATVGKTFQFKGYEGRACFAGYLIKARPNKKVLSDFLNYFTRSNAYENWKNSIFNQATIQNIGADKYSVLPLPLPSITEQKEIAGFIITKCERIDRIISRGQQSLELLKEFRTSLISEVVTGKIDLRNYSSNNEGLTNAT